MTNNNIFTKSKIKTLFVMLLTCILSLSVFFVTACKEEEPEDAAEYDPSYSYTEYEDTDALVSNANFALGLADKDLSDYPVKSATGWSVSSDSGSSSSETTSGVIGVNEEEWKAVLASLVSEEAYLEWAEEKYNFTKDAIEDTVKAENENISDDDLEEKVEDKLVELLLTKVTNPSVHEGATDKNVAMLSNVSSTTAVDKIGVSQAIASGNAITIAKGEYAKISVWVYTDAANERGSANIRLATTINGVTQAKYVATGIDTNGAWKQYTVYVKGNEYVESSVTLSLGFGLADNKTSSTEHFAYGTCYFDDITAEIITAEAFDAVVDASLVKVSSMGATSYNGNPNDYVVSVANNGKVSENVTNLFYSLSFEDWSAANYADAHFNVNSSLVFEGAYLDSEDASKFDEASTASLTATADGFTATMEKSVYTVKLTDNGNNFKVAPNKFVSISFNLTNGLSKYNKDGVSVFVYDIKGEAVQKSAVLSVTTPDEGEDYVITVKNNFKATEGDDGVREFYLLFVFGTTTPTEQSSHSRFPTGTITVKNVKTAEGYSVETIEDGDNEIENEFYDRYAFFNHLETTLTATNVSYSLYAGKTGDYSETTESDTHSFEYSYANTSILATQPVAAVDYYGVVPTHQYVVENGEVTDVNTLKTAGVINSAYLDNYAEIEGLADIKANFGKTLDADEKTIQPLMIYNSDLASYGYIAKNSVSVSAESTSVVTLKVRVTGEAVAYIYLVDTSNEGNKLNVLTHKFTGNYGDQTAEYSNQLAVKVTADTVAKYGEDGWVTVTFNVASGATALSYRVELWNGSRDGANKSKGYVFFDDVSTSGTFTETTTVNGYKTSGVLNTAYTNVVNGVAVLDDADIAKGLIYKRELSDAEVAYNEENPDTKVSYAAKYVWLTNTEENGDTTFVYAIYNSIDPKAVNPNATTEEEVVTEEEATGCQGGKFDAATFWLQFSTIALAVLLVAVVLLIVIKFFRRRRKKAVKAKAKYNVSSRNKALSEAKKAERANKSAEALAEQSTEESTEEVQEPAEEATEETVEEADEATDDTEYTYGEVLEDFGDDVVVDGAEVALPETEEKPEATEDKPE